MSKPWLWSYETPAAVPYVGLGEETEALYAAEKAAGDAVHAVAKRLAPLLDHTLQEFWSRSMVEALAAVVNTFSPSIGIAAAVGYLRHHGFEVVPPTRVDNGKGA